MIFIFYFTFLLHPFAINITFITRKENSRAMSVLKKLDGDFFLAHKIILYFYL